MRTLIFIGLIYLAYRFIRSALTPVQSGTRPDAGGGVPAADDIMVQDPVCAVYFPKREGVHLRRSGKDLYFCSQSCMDAFVASGTPTENE